ncbi:MAG: hypothetical protein NTV51_16930 [Verrucomicrobia bacterium]|nr:hypothetical protein [Verrucomicrobiota bacterium]
MISRLAAVPLVLLALCSTLFAAPPPAPGPEAAAGGGALVKGVMKSRLVEILGLPTEIVGPDLWVYRNYDYADPVAVRENYDTLVVRVTGDRVTLIRLVNGESLDALVAACAAATPARHGALVHTEPGPRRH